MHWCAEIKNGNTILRHLQIAQHNFNIYCNRNDVVKKIPQLKPQNGSKNSGTLSNSKFPLLISHTSHTIWLRQPVNSLVVNLIASICYWRIANSRARLLTAAFASDGADFSSYARIKPAKLEINCPFQMHNSNSTILYIDTDTHTRLWKNVMNKLYILGRIAIYRYNKIYKY